MILKILKTLELINKASGKIALNNLEILSNKGQNEPLLGGYFIQLLRQMKQERLIDSDKNEWYFSITQKGLDYLKEHAEE
ncbi:hypothetical protein [uncultured Chryseobacterium sp.]|uniref:hypothetical protein n=1 Tax=uncultured Chryseobacterium sp. TaxID=259322 RepID=UPI0025CC5933|nr:hypothetical protein [uncultured Chryseobacterium sp.]